MLRDYKKFNFLCKVTYFVFLVFFVSVNFDHVDDIS